MQQGTAVQGLHQVMRNALVVSVVILVALGLDLTLFPKPGHRRSLRSSPLPSARNGSN